MADVSEVVTRSMNINEKLGPRLKIAAEQNAILRIGWTNAGDPVPKNGELGLCPALPEGARLRALGVLGSWVAAFGTGGSFTIQGDAGSFLGAANQGTTIVCERMAGNYPELAYNRPLQESRLPSNIHVYEFYFPAGRRLQSSQAQQLYTSTNYTHAVRDLLTNNVNVIAQLVAYRGDDDGGKLSLSCNPDLTLDLLPEIKRRREKGEAIVIAGQVNTQLPFMAGPAAVKASEFDLLLSGPDWDFDLFAVPKQPVSLRDYASAFRSKLQYGLGCELVPIRQRQLMAHSDIDSQVAILTIFQIENGVLSA